MIPLDNNGYIPPGLHNYTFNEYHKQFVTAYPMSQTRRVIHNKTFQWLSLINQVIQPQELWFDGSFISNKINPRDLDIVLFFNPHDLSNQKNLQVKKLIQVSQQYYCHAACAIIVNKKSNLKYVNQRSYWRGQFGFDRKDIPKGIIILEWREVIKGLGG